MKSIVISEPAKINAMLAMGLCPPTDNLQCLISLGFKREFPHISAGEKAHRWIRTVDQGYQQIGKSFKAVVTVQRARLSCVAQSAASAQLPVNKAAAMREANRPTTELVASILAKRHTVAQ